MLTLMKKDGISCFKNEQEPIQEVIISCEKLPSRALLVMVELARSAYLDALGGFFLGSRVNQRRYIWTDESKCNVSELGDLETKNELSVLVKQHLDELFYSANRNGVKAPAHMEMVGFGFPPTSSCSNHVKVDGDTLAEAESSPFNGGLLCLKLN